LDDHSPYDTQIFARRTQPHRSLNRAGFIRLLMIFSAMSFCVTLPFVFMGAWPVAGFMGVDVAIFYFAFRSNFRAARAYEDVIVTPLALHIEKVSQRGQCRRWRFNPQWVRLERQEDEDFGLIRLAAVSRDRQIEIATWLAPDARAEFADGLSRALAEARRGPTFNQA
jgi:uncharacterized membrane protein